MREFIRFRICIRQFGKWTSLLLCGMWLLINRAYPLGAIEPGASQTANNAGIFVGINKFPEDQDVTPLTACVNDAILLAHAFVIQTPVLAPENTYLLISGDAEGQAIFAKLAALQAAGVKVSKEATKTRILQSLQSAISVAEQPGDVLIAAFSSHGFEDRGTLYLLPADGLFKELEQTAINVTGIERSLAKSVAKKRLLILDACRAFPFRDSKSAIDIHGASDFYAELGKTEGQAVIASCDSGQVSWEDQSLGHGVFTFYFVEALQGKAAADPRGYIRLGAVLDHAAHEVERWSKTKPIPQHPFLKGPIGAKDIPLAIATAAHAAAKRQLEVLRKMAYSSDEDTRLSPTEWAEVEGLFTRIDLSALEEKRLQVYIDLADNPASIRTARTALDLLPKLETPDNGRQPPQALNRLATWVGRKMPMVIERIDGAILRTSFRQLCVEEINGDKVIGTQWAYGEKIGEFSGSSGDSRVSIPAAPGQTGFAEFELELSDGRPTSDFSMFAWAKDAPPARVHHKKLRDRDVFLLELPPRTHALTVDRIRERSRSNPDQELPTIMNGKRPFCPYFVQNGITFDIADLCQTRAARLTGIFSITDQDAMGYRRMEFSVEGKVVVDGTREVWSKRATSAAPFVYVDVQIPKGTRQLFVGTQRARQSMVWSDLRLHLAD